MSGGEGFYRLHKKGRHDFAIIENGREIFLTDNEEEAIRKRLKMSRRSKAMLWVVVAKSGSEGEILQAIPRKPNSRDIKDWKNRWRIVRSMRKPK